MSSIPQPSINHRKRLTPTLPIASPVDAYREAVLIQRCQTGDAAAWDTLIRRYEKWVYQLAYTFCHNQEDAGDIAGQVFLRLYKSLHTYRHEARFASWLFSIVRYTYLDQRIRSARYNPLSLNAISMQEGEPPFGWNTPDPAPSPETICLENDVAQRLTDAIHHLPDYQRQALRMNLIEGKSYQEIAEATGLSLGTVKSRLYRARTMLRERLTPFHETLTVEYVSSASSDLQER